MAMDEKKFAFILCSKDRDAFQKTLIALQEVEIPSGFQAELVEIYGEDKIATMYNEAIRRSNAKYKIYINVDVAAFHRLLLYKIRECFALEPRAAILGLQGSELPMDGDYLSAHKCYGNYYLQRDDGTIVPAGEEEIPLFAQSVHVVDDSFWVTCEDCHWNENMQGPFLLASYCTDVRKNGYRVVTVEQNLAIDDIWVVFTNKSNKDYWQTHRQEYDNYRQKFVQTYQKTYLPLVSILIPAYNEPVFFEQALNSALAQTYGNIEIIVGDDSTNMEICHLLQPYLQKYKNIKYYRHNHPLGKKGWDNIEFLLQKSRGKYINILMQDDFMKEHKIMRMMEYYIRDLNDEIGIVTSDRYKINSKNSIIGIVNGWQGQLDRIVAGKTIGEKLLYQGCNFVGELSTVLIPKEFLYDEYRNLSIWSTFCDYTEYSMSDLSTWLEIARRGRKFVLISECLSAFRVHERQNTGVDIIQITARLDWLAFYVLSWQQRLFDVDEDTCLYLMSKFVSHNPLHMDEPSLSKNDKVMYEKYHDIEIMIKNSDKHNAIKAVLSYIQQDYQYE